MMGIERSRSIAYDTSKKADINEVIIIIRIEILAGNFFIIINRFHDHSGTQEARSEKNKSLLYVPVVPLAGAIGKNTHPE